MPLELSVSTIVPSNGAVTRPPLPSTGSLGYGSPASTVLWAAPTSGRPSRHASFPSPGGTPAAPLFRFPGAVERSGLGPGVLSHPGPLLGRLRGGVQTSQVPGGPWWACPALRPRRSFGARSLRRLPVAFRHLNGVGLRHCHTFGAVLHGPPPRCLRFTSTVTRDRARLASGW